MTTKNLVMISGAIEAATAVALIAAPSLVGRLLLGVELSSAGMAVGRIAGFGLLSLAIACWPNKHGAGISAVQALFVYNLLAALYLGYLVISGEFFTYLLWLACALHGLLTLLFARPAYQSVSTPKAD